MTVFISKSATINLCNFSCNEQRRFALFLSIYWLFLKPLLVEVEKMLLLCSDCSHLKSCKTDLTVFVNRMFYEFYDYEYKLFFVQVLSNGANAYVPTYRN